MERNNNADTDRGQVGIGTLIVFIAMVLVAAIAAGVLINTAGFLQTQAEDTGTESTAQVADALNVITEVGEVGENSTISELRIGVQPAAGASDINLAELSIQYTSDDNFSNLVAGFDEDADINDEDDLEDARASGDTNPSDLNPQAYDEAEDNVSTTQRYGIDVVTAEQEGDIVMTDNSDRYEIIINTSGDEFDGIEGHDNDDTLETGDFLGPLEEGSDVQLTITTEVGSQTVAFLQVPDSLVGYEEEDTVNL